MGCSSDAWKTLALTTPGFLNAITGLNSPLTVSIMHLAAVRPMSCPSRWG